MCPWALGACRRGDSVHVASVSVFGEACACLCGLALCVCIRVFVCLCVSVMAHR